MAEYRRQIIGGGIAAVILAISIGVAVIYVPTLNLQGASTSTTQSTSSSTSTPVTIYFNTTSTKLPDSSRSQTIVTRTTSEISTVTVTSYENGSATTVYSNGSLTTVYRNGTTVYQNNTQTETFVSTQTSVATVTEIVISTVYTSSGSGCPSFAGPGAPIDCVPVYLSNSQSSPVSAGTQMSINVDWSGYSSYLSSNVGNVMFADASGNPLYAWCESNCTNSQSSSNVWIKDDYAIPASGQQTVYMYIFPSGVSNYLSTGYWGAYPTFTSTYGQYDNGPSVFSFYNNFNGTSLCSCMSIFGSPNVVVDNGIKVSTSSCDGCGVQTKETFSPDLSFDSLTNATVGAYYMNVGPEETTAINQNGVFADYDISGNAILITQNNGVQHHTLSETEPVGYAIWSNSWTSTEVYQQLNYGSQLSTSTDIPTIPLPWTLLVWSGVSTSISAQWTRTRVLPPDNVLPSVSFGTLSAY